MREKWGTWKVSQFKKHQNKPLIQDRSLYAFNIYSLKIQINRKNKTKLILINLQSTLNNNKNNYKIINRPSKILLIKLVMKRRVQQKK
jgi:hypothetical protein